MRAIHTPAFSNSAAMGILPGFDDEGPLLDDSRETVFHYVQWHVNDYLAGTAALDAEQEGVYIRFLMQLYSHGKPLPDDDYWMSRLLRLSVRVWRRVKSSLADLGKIVVRNRYLTNSRFEQERIKRAEDMKKRSIAAHARWAKTREKAQTLPKVSAKFGESLGQTSAKSSQKPNEINGERVKEDMLTNNQNPLTNKKESNNNRLSDSQLAPLLEQAAGACLKNPAACPGLLVLSTPRRWLEQGCDLHLDVLPVLKAVGSKRPLRSVSDWNYFTNAIADAKAKRSVPMPVGDSEAMAEAKFREREKMIRHRAGVLGITTEEYREKLKEASRAH